MPEDQFFKKHNHLTIVWHAFKKALRVMGNIDLKALHKLHLAAISTLESLERTSRLGSIHKRHIALIKSMLGEGSSSKRISEFGHQLKLTLEYEDSMNSKFIDSLYESIGEVGMIYVKYIRPSFSRFIALLGMENAATKFSAEKIITFEAIFSRRNSGKRRRVTS